MRRPFFRSLFPKVLVGYFGLALLQFTFRIGGSASNSITAFFYLASFAFELLAVWWVVRGFGARHPQGRAFLVLLFGMGSAAVGQIIWQVFQYTLRVTPHEAAAPFYLAGYLLVAIGFILEIRAVSIDWRKLLPQVGAFLAVAAGILGLAYLRFVPPGTYQITVSYFAGDILLILLSALILRLVLEYQTGLLGRSWLWILAAQLTVIVGDIILAVFYPYFLADQWPYTVVNLLWMSANLCVAHGAYSIADAIRQAQAKMQRRTPASEA